MFENEKTLTSYEVAQKVLKSGDVVAMGAYLKSVFKDKEDEKADAVAGEIGEFLLDNATDKEILKTVLLRIPELGERVVLKFVDEYKAELEFSDIKLMLYRTTSQEIISKILDVLRNNRAIIDGFSFAYLLEDYRIDETVKKELKEILLSPETPTEALFNVFYDGKLEKEIKPLLIERDLQMFLKWDKSIRCFWPSYKDNTGAEFSTAHPVLPKWVSEQLQEKPISSGKKLLESVANDSMYGSIA
jgi:hypothetical protein